MNNNSIINSNSNLNREERVIYFDILNILACFSVVLIHMNGIVHTYSNSIEWKTALIFEVICYWAVPMFIMLSGATLLKYRERYNTKCFFKKRFIKVLIPYIVWSLIIFIINKNSINLNKFIEAFMYDKIEGTYWFFSLIIYLYCLIPVLSILTEKEENRNIMWGIVLFIFVFQSLLQPICKIFKITYPPILNYMCGQNGYIIYLLLGYLLSTMELKKTQKRVIYALAICLFLMRYLYTLNASINTGILNTDSWGAISVVSVIPSVAVFILIKSVNWKRIFNLLKIDAKVVSKISSCSFGIYLIHMLVKNKLTKIFELDIYSIWYRTIGAILLYFLCLDIIYLIKKIPIIRKIVP